MFSNYSSQNSKLVGANITDLPLNDFKGTTDSSFVEHRTLEVSIGRVMTVNLVVVSDHGNYYLDLNAPQALIL